MANKTIRDFHGSFNVSESYTTYKSEDQIDEATPPSGPKNPDKPHVGKTAHEKKVERYQQYLAKKKRDREQHLRNNPGLKQGGERRRIQPNAFYSKRAFRNQEINASFDPDLSEADKSEYSKLMKQYGDMPMSKVPMKTRLRIRELGRKVRGDKSVSGLRASDLVDDMKRRQMGEASFMVDIEGIGKVVIDGTSAAEIKTSLRKVLRKKDMIGDVERVGVSAKKKHFMSKAMGKEEEEEIDEAKSDRLEKIARAAAAREKDQAAQKEKAKQKHYAASKKSREAIDYFKKGGNKDQFGRVREDIEQFDENRAQSMTNRALDKVSREKSSRSDDEFEVKYAKSKRGPIQVSKFGTLNAAKGFLAAVKKKGMNGIISKGGKPVREEIEQVDEAGMIGRTKPSRELNIQKFEKKYLGTKSLKDAKRAAHKAERKKGKMDIQKGD